MEQNSVKFATGRNASFASIAGDPYSPRKSLILQLARELALPSQGSAFSQICRYVKQDSAVSAGVAKCIHVEGIPVITQVNTHFGTAIAVLLFRDRPWYLSIVGLDAPEARLAPAIKRAVSDFVRAASR